MTEPDSPLSATRCLGPQTILVVENHAALRRGIPRTLEEATYTVEEACDEQTVLTQVRTSSDPLMVLLNDHLPDFTGSGALDVQNVEGALDSHSFILMSTLPSESFVTLAQDDGAPLLEQSFFLGGLAARGDSSRMSSARHIFWQPMTAA